MIKILQIVNYFYPKIGGIEQVAKDISEVLLKHCDKYEQKIICFNEDAQNDGIVCKRSETVHDTVNGVEVIRCGCFTKMFSQSMSFTFGSKLKKVMNEFKPDVVIFHYPNPFQAHFLLRYKKRNFKLILYWHLDITKQKILKKFFYFQNLNLIKHANKILGATYKHLDESEFSKFFGGKKYILPYAINAKRLILSENEREKSEEIRKHYFPKILCFFIGRHVPYKGLTYLVKSSKMLDDRFEFIIAGKGPLTEELKQEASGDSKIKFVGQISDSEWRAYLNACDIFCFPSITQNECFGLALAEAMYYGKPAVTFTIPGSGVNYVSLDGVTGIECPNRDVKAYADALRKLADDPVLRKKYGKNARERVIENFTFEQFMDNILKLINNL